MRSIERRFGAFQIKDKSLGDYINFVRSVRKQRFNKETISRWFNKLVGKNEYDKRDKKLLIQHLIDLSNTGEDHQRETMFVPPLINNYNLHTHQHENQPRRN